MRTKNSQSGQTMIEVIVALYMLTMALVAGLGLAIYSNTRNINNKNVLVATNLAREGVEAVRIMRDTNWLAAEDPTPNGFTNNIDDLQNCNFGGGVNLPCYPEAFADPFDLQDSNNAGDYRLLFSPDNDRPNFTLDRRNGQETFFLCKQANGQIRHDNTCTATNAQFARKITIRTGSTNAPYTADANNPTSNAGHSPEKIVTSTVLWRGKSCLDFTFNIWPNSLTGYCEITVVERMTNWKDYR